MVAFVVMNDRPAPRCKRRRDRCGVDVQPIRMSTVRYARAYFLRVSRTPDRKTLPAVIASAAKQSISRHRKECMASRRVIGRAFANPFNRENTWSGRGVPELPCSENTEQPLAAFYRLSNGIY